MTVPRKLPRTQDQRVQNVSRNHAAQSLGGSTAAARPVANVKPDVKVYAPSSSGGNVVTGGGDVTALSITSTVAGAGTSSADGVEAVAVGPNAYSTSLRSVALGSDALADANEAIAIGRAANANYPGLWAVAIGRASQTNAGSSVAIGANALTTTSAAYGVAVGCGTHSSHAGGVAIGADHTGSPAQTTADDDFVLGTANHHVIVAGALVLSDGSGGLWRVTVSGGSLSAVAYP